jgi:tripartite-type tricarboxylate transporter receptor subunit TctC
MMCTTGTLSIQPHLLKSMPFNPETDIVPVTQVANAPYMLLVNAALPVKSVKELSPTPSRSRARSISRLRATAPAATWPARC